MLGSAGGGLVGSLQKSSMGHRETIKATRSSDPNLTQDGLGGSGARGCRA